MERPQLKEYYIAYFDILGYKESLKNNTDLINELLDIIHSVISGTKNYINEINNSPLVGAVANVNIQYKAFSDNILLCLEKTDSAFETNRLLIFLSSVADIQQKFSVQHGLFIQGGITQGPLAISDDFVFGQGLIDVVEMESSAIYPRIVLSQIIVNDLKQIKFDDDDLNFALAFENRKDKNNITDEERERYKEVLSQYKQYAFYKKWANTIIWTNPDGNLSLSYLYKPDFEHLISEKDIELIANLVQTISPSDYEHFNSARAVKIEPILKRHKEILIGKLQEYGTLDSNITDLSELKNNEYILKKYLWVWLYHNSICQLYQCYNYVIQLTFAPEYFGFNLTTEVYHGSNEDKSD